MISVKIRRFPRFGSVGRREVCMKMHVWMGFLPISGRSIENHCHGHATEIDFAKIDEISPSWFSGALGPAPWARLLPAPR